MKIEGDIYKERTKSQLENWCNGISIHNDIDDECCPDFSCCDKNINTPLEQRKIFRELHEKNDPRAEQMLFRFLGEMLINHDIDVHIARKGNIDLN